MSIPLSDSSYSRRRFLALSASAGVGVAAASAFGPLSGRASAAMAVAAPGVPGQAMGLQLFSVRDQIATRGFAVVLAELAEIGYTHIEFAGYNQRDVGPITVQEIKQILDDNGLTATGAHANVNALLDPAQREAVFADALVLGMPNIGTGSDFGGQTVAEIEARAALWNDSGAAAAAHGLKLYQHNHANEFAFTTDRPELRRYDVFLQASDPRFVFLEMDILWAYGGARKYPWPMAQGPATGVYGFDPADYVVRNPERYPLFHAKDGTANADPLQGNSFTPVEFGAGAVPFRNFFAKVGARAANVPLWEQDTAPSTPPELGGTMGAADRSYDAMHRTRSLTWMDELARMLTDAAAAGHVDETDLRNLLRRVEKAVERFLAGQDASAAAYLDDLATRAQRRITVPSVRSSVVSTARTVQAWIETSADVVSTA